MINKLTTIPGKRKELCIISFLDSYPADLASYDTVYRLNVEPKFMVYDFLVNVAQDATSGPDAEGPIINVIREHKYLFVVSCKCITIWDATVNEYYSRLQTIFTPIIRNKDHAALQRVDIRAVQINNFHELDMYPREEFSLPL